MEANLTLQYLHLVYSLANLKSFSSFASSKPLYLTPGGTTGAAARSLTALHAHVLARCKCSSAALEGHFGILIE